METSAGKVAIVKIGASLVGRIRINYTDFVACSSLKSPVKAEFSKKVPVEKGAELGAFELGSTVVLLFPEGKVKLCEITGKKVKMGEKNCNITYLKIYMDLSVD
ncbi:Phosphatidylserine decarboxylase proenzyme [uncultured archaeon]|nr:Phosphatidylserine decarboxylase proenzyme [uncultured archaeon]